MPTTAPPGRAWLQADVERDVAEGFKVAAANADRSATQHLRHLIRQEARNGEAPATTPGPRETSTARQGRHDGP